MSVVRIDETWQGRDGDDDVSNNRNHTRVWLVKTSDPADTDTVVKAAGPSLLDKHPNDPGALAQERSAVQHADDPTVWTLTVKYSTKLDFLKVAFNPSYGGAGGIPSPGGTGGSDGNPQQHDEDPLKRQSLEFDSEHYQVIVDKDADGVEYRNSATVPFKDVQKERSRLLMVHTYNQLDYSPYVFDDLLDHCNDGVFMNYFLSTTVWFYKHHAVWTNDNGRAFWQITNSYRINRGGWGEHQVKDQGNMVFDEDELWYLLDKYGNVRTDDFRLDGEGQPLAVEEETIYLIFKDLPLADFSVLMPVQS